MAIEVKEKISYTISEGHVRVIVNSEYPSSIYINRVDGNNYNNYMTLDRDQIQNLTHALKQALEIIKNESF